MADRKTRINGNQIKDGTVTADELNVSVAGNSITGGAGTALSVQVDNATIEAVAGTGNLLVKDAGITAAKLGLDSVTAAKINSDVAGLGLVQAVGGELDVNVDGSSIEINVDTLRVKAAGITDAMLAVDYIQATEVDGTTIEFAGNTLNVVANGIKAAQLDETDNYAFTGSISLTTVPLTGNDVANKTYVDSVAQGLDVKDSVRVTSTSNITLSGTQTIDGVLLAVGERVLVQGQTTGSENGVYIVSATGWARATDYPTALSAASTFMFVEEGTVNADAGFVCTNDVGTDVVGTDSLFYSQFSGAGQITAGAGLSKTGNTLDINVIGAMEIDTDAIDVANGGIDAIRLATDSVTTIKILDANVTTAKLATSAVTTIKILDANVTTAKIADSAITEPKLDAANAPVSGQVLSYNGTNFTWISGTADAVVETDMVKGVLSPALGAETVMASFSGSAAVVPNSVQVFLNGLLQEEGVGDDYTINVTTGVVTFTTALDAGDIVDMRGVLNN